MLDLYTWRTPNGRKVPILLAELELPYQLHLIDLGKHEQKTAAYLAINPNGKIPALIDRADGGEPVRDFRQERDVVERARANAIAAGLSPQLGEELVLSLIRASLTVQERDRVAADGPGGGRRVLVIGGAADDQRGPGGRCVGEIDEPRARALVGDGVADRAHRGAGLGASVSAGLAAPPVAASIKAGLPADAAVLDVASVLFFQDPFANGRAQVDAALAHRPTVVVALDFLFWFAYADASPAERRARLDAGLALLAPLPGTLLVGDLPDMRNANPRVLGPAAVPSPDELAALEARLGLTLPVVTALDWPTVLGR